MVVNKLVDKFDLKLYSVLVIIIQDSKNLTYLLEGFFAMNISICKKFTFFLFISFFIISHIHPKNNDSPVNVLDNFTGQALKQSEVIHNSLSEMSAMINDNQVPSIVGKKRKKTLHEIKEINQFIQGLLQTKSFSVSPTPATTLFLIQCNRALMVHILDALSENFKDFSLENFLALASTVTRSPKKVSSNIPVEQQLYQELALNEQLLKEFSQKTDQVGLAWWNIWYRNVDKYLIDPCKRYKIPRHTITASLFSAWYVYFAWQLGDNLPKFLQLPQSFKNAEWFKKFMGKKPYIEQIPGMGGEIPAEKAEGFINGLDFIIALLKKNFLPIGSVLTAACAYRATTEWKRFKPIFNEKLSILVNRLKGGSYLKKANKLQGIIEEVYFDDLVGASHVKDFYKNLIAYLENPEVCDRLGISPPKGCLLIGDTRTGKSYSVRALFTELNQMLERDNRKDEFKFFELSASDINTEGIGYLLSVIKSCAPCIVFIDEIDLLDLQRRGKNSMLSEFLTCMSGALSSGDSKNQVIIIAATNRPENLDEALRTPGRFGKELRFEYPSFEDRKEFITKQLNKLSLDLGSFDIDKLTRETEGKAYEALKLLINQSILKARIHNEMLTQRHLEETLNETIRNVIEENFKEIPLHEKELLSIHFAGHALALMLLDIHTKFASVTIKPVMMQIKEEFMGAHLWQDGNGDDDDKQKRIGYGEIFTHHNHDTINIMSKAEKLDLCKYYLAGIAAEEVILGSCSFSCHTQDKEKALTLIKSLVFEGHDIKKLPEHIQNQLYDKAFELLNKCKQETISLLTLHKETLLTVAQTLQKRNMLNRNDVKHIIDQANNTDEIIEKSADTVGDAKNFDSDVTVEPVSNMVDDTVVTETYNSEQEEDLINTSTSQA